VLGIYLRVWEWDHAEIRDMAAKNSKYGERDVVHLIQKLVHSTVRLRLFKISRSVLKTVA
jgi:hypothetical protein